jgi:hypothetical protein
MDREQVRDAICREFAELPLPNPRTLIRPLESRMRSGGEELRNALAGKTWQSLTPEFLTERWSAFSYLSPKAYRYYLPALLNVALEQFVDTDLTHSVLWELRPSFWLLYYEGKDDDLRYQQSAFTTVQYRTVCAFLGLVFDQFPGLRHLAAQALHWGWNRFDTPALEAANKYYHELRSFSFPEPEDPEIADLCREIRSAFAATPYPGDDKLSGTEVGDESSENAMELRGVKWQSAHPELLARCDSALNFLSDDGFRYFLPAFLMADLMYSQLYSQWGSYSNASPVFSLTHGLHAAKDINMDLYLTTFSTQFSGELNTTLLKRMGITPEEWPERVRDLIKRHNERQKTFDWREYTVRRMMPFTRKERRAIIHYLEFQAKNGYRANEIDQALEGYWRPSVQSLAT